MSGRRMLRLALLSGLWGLASAAPSQEGKLLIIAGHPKCGTSHLHRLIAAHPNVLGLRKEQCPLVNRAQKPWNKILPWLRTLTGQQDPSDLQPECVKQGIGSDFCKDVLHHGTARKSASGRDVLLTCIFPDRLWKYHPVYPMRNVRVLYGVRDPAEWYWAAYHWWSFWGDKFCRACGPMMTSWKTSYRSPEHFHEIMNSRGKLHGPPHANITKMLSEMRHLRQTFLADNIFFLRSEDLNNDTVLERMFQFLNLTLQDIPLDLRRGRSNEGAMMKLRTMFSKQRTDGHAQGTYELSGYRPMQCKTRELIYNISRQGCRDLSREFGLNYPACLGEEPAACSETTVTAAPSTAAPSTSTSVSTSAPSASEDAPSAMEPSKATASATEPSKATPSPMEMLVIACSVLLGFLLGRSGACCGRSGHEHRVSSAVEYDIVGAPAE